MRTAGNLRSTLRSTFALAVAVTVIVPDLAFARPGGGGGRGPGGPGPGAGRPAVGGGSRPRPGGSAPGAGGDPSPGPGRVIDGGPAAGGRVIEGGVPSSVAPSGARSVETFINAKPATATAKPGTVAAKAVVDPGMAKSRTDSLKASLEGRTQPFTAAWYAEHPNAWQYTHPYAEWWAVAGVVGLSNWLGYAVSSAGATAGTTATTTTTSGSTAASAESTADGEAAATPPADLEWLPLGVYATAPRGAAQAHVYQQLAVSRKGELKGNFYDSISNTVQPVGGTIDPETRKASWTVGTAGGATFETTLDALVKTPSGVTMKSGGSVQEWELVQVEKPGDKPSTP